MTIPGLRPRAAETQAVLAALSAQGFDDVAPEDAKAVLTAAVEVVLDRDWWVVVQVVPNEPIQFVYGLFATEPTAKKVAEMNALGALSGWSVGVVHIDNARKQLERVRLL